MSDKLSDIIAASSPGTVLSLPSGEFEGPVTITKPMRIVGNNTTVWAKRGSVISIASPGVTLENLRVELTEGSVSDAAITAEKPAAVNNVEILGEVRGFGAEDGTLDIPRTLELGAFASETVNSFIFTVNVPVKTEIVSSGSEISLEPRVLETGRNQIVLTVNGFASGTILFAEILFKSRFTRRVYVTGKASSSASPADRKSIYTAPERPASQPAVTENRETDVVSVAAMPETFLPAIALQRGQRVSLTKYAGDNFSIYFSCEKPQDMDIDPYLFLLDENEKAPGDTGLVFFGNERSDNGEAVYFPSDGHLEIDLSKADPKIRKITIAYSVYAGSTVRNFSSVRNPQAALWTDSERISFKMNELSDETTVVAMEIYLYKGEWKISAVGAGFKDGMAKLCNRFGIEVE